MSRGFSQALLTEFSQAISWTGAPFNGLNWTLI